MQNKIKNKITLIKIEILTMKSFKNGLVSQKKRWAGLALGLGLLLSSCGSLEKTVYFQDSGQEVVQEITQKYEVHIHQDDLLSIVINSTNPELAVPFNAPVVSYQIGGNPYGQATVMGYLVDVNGYIDFPVLGRIKVGGMTRDELNTYIKNRIIEEGYINDPIVSVKFLNFKISVMGEVGSPGNFTVSGDRITVLEALSMAGDLTIYGKRDRVAVIRENQGIRSLVYLDLRSSKIFESPYYFLQQNDIVYVEPNKRRAQQAEINQNNSVGTWVSIASLLTSMAVLIWK